MEEPPHEFEFRHQSFHTVSGSRSQELLQPQPDCCQIHSLSTATKQGKNLELSGCWHPRVQEPIWPSQCHCLPCILQILGQTRNRIPEPQSKGAEKVRFLPSLFSNSDKKQNMGRGWKGIQYQHRRFIFIVSAVFFFFSWNQSFY